MIQKAKKSLGQNFLTAQSVVDKMIETADIKEEDIVLEVGPGKGILTQSLLQTARKVIAIEKDDNLIPYLQEKFTKEIKDEKLILIHNDILTLNFQLYKLSDYKIVANIPYYITGEFLRKTLSSDIQPSNIVLLLQKEVAERIANSKKQSILSVSVRVYGEPKYIQTVKRGSFAPAPNVDSAILAINNISKKFFSTTPHNQDRPRYEKRFFEIVKAGFAHKRKFLISNLSILANKEKLKVIFKKLEINEKTRAEDLSVEGWGELTQSL